MVDLDRPVSEAPLQDGGCGMPPAMSTPPPVAPPSMSVNLNAQGLDNISDMMRLFQKVNPDMLNPKAPMPSLGAPPSIMSIKPSMPPLKMLPDFDDDKIDLPPMHDKDHAMMKTLDKDGDGDHDMDDHDVEKKRETYVNEPDPETKSIDYMNNQLAGGLNRPKNTFPKVADGDNPMQRVKEGSDLRAQIRAELLQRLAEAKGAK